jgi:hypothetical protein
MCCEHIIGEESLATNCGVEESPMGDPYSRGDSVGEPANQRQCETQQIPATTETHWGEGRVFVQLNAYSDQLNADT